VNAKGKDINSKGWVGNQLFRLAKEMKKRKEEARSLQEISKKPFGGFKTVNSMLMTKC
jgi:hypothetical protein